MNKIYVGYDPREHIPSAVCCSSIRRRTDIPVRELRLADPDVQAVFTRPWHRQGAQYIDDLTDTPCSTQFSFSRFLVPYLNNYKGWALFVDCDMMFLESPDVLFQEADDSYAVMCVQHEHVPVETRKMDDIEQTTYPRKNWSSVVMYNCGHPANRALTPGAVNRETGQWLHGFKWLDDALIGKLDPKWNYLVGYDTWKDRPVGNVHWTVGGPWWKPWRHGEFADEWYEEMMAYKEP